MSTAVAEAPAPDGKAFITEAFDIAFGQQSARSAGEPASEIKKTPEEPKSQGDLAVENQPTEPKPEGTQEQPVEEVKPEETSEDTTETAEPALNEKGQYRWGELKKESKTQKAKITELETELSRFKQESQELVQIRSQLEAAKKELDAAHGELYTVRVEVTPEWKQTVSEPFTQLSQSVDDLAKMTNVDGDKIMDAVIRASKGDRQAIIELTEGWQDWDKSEIRDQVKNMVAINRRAEDLKKDSRNAYETSMKNQQELTVRQQQELAKTYQKATNDISESFKSNLDKYLPEDGKIDYAKIGLETSTGGIDKWTPEEKVFATFAANAIVPMKNLIESQAKDLKAARAELAKLRNGAPTANTNGNAPSSPKDVQKKETLDEIGSKSYEQLAQETVGRFSWLK